MVDMAHIAGLVAAGLHQSPVPYADITTTTTHKTLRGPRGGLILTNDEALAKKINSAIFPGTQGGPLMHTIAAKAVCFGEALKPEFKEYQTRIVENAKALAEGLIKRGFNLVSGGTDNHPEKPFVTSGIRIGTPAVTTRGLGVEEMEKIAEYIYLCATDFENKADEIRAGVTEICNKYPLYK